MTFVVVAFTAGSQMMRIDGSDQRWFVGLTVLAALIVAFFTYTAVGSTASMTPLHRALTHCGELFGVGIPRWLRFLEVVLSMASSS